MKWQIQFSRYVVVGLASNAVIYALYLVLTYGGVGHKTAMTLLYALGVLQTFYFNRRWSFRHDGHVSRALFRYVVAYLFGYLVNLLALLWLVDHLGCPHQWVQGGMIFALAVMLFLLQRHWVFHHARVASSETA
jgi:putative flippase GtrA